MAHVGAITIDGDSITGERDFESDNTSPLHGCRARGLRENLL